MVNIIKRIVCMVCCFIIIPIILGGCSKDFMITEIDEINIIRVMGIDYGQEEYTISALFTTIDGKEEITKGKGKSPYAAYEDLKIRAKKAISIGHTGYFLIGEEAANKGIDLCLDFLSSDETIKMDSLFYITKDSKASDFLEGGIEKEQKINEDMEVLRQKQEIILTRNDNTLVNLLNEIKQTFQSVLIPYVIAEESSFLTPGYAVFDDLKLRDYLDEDTTAGVNFIKNIIRNYPIYLEDEVGLLITFSETDIDTNWISGKLTINVKVDYETMIKEVNTTDNIFNYEYIKGLNMKQDDYVLEIIELAVNYTKATGLDILQMAKYVENQNIEEWNKQKETWDTVISDIQYEYKLNSRISKSFLLGDNKYLKK
ncbi:MAG: hypothetical protein GX915_08575 [Clostridiales bacterium]|nr:hypothetical protein [Clostridiales bacterium]